MSILIKGVEMPTENNELRLIIHSNGQVIISHKTHYEEAEAVSVPPYEVFGTWEWDPDGMDWGIGAWKCSNCSSKAETWWAKDGNSNPLKFAGSHYCGNCGATMRK